MTNVVGLACDTFPTESTQDTKLNKEGCALRMDGVPRSRVLVDIDKLDVPDDQPHPDFLFFLDQSGSWAIPIEIKRGTPKMGHVVKQLQGGAQIIENRIGPDKVDHFRALLVSGNVAKAGRPLLKDARVIFNRQEEPIIRLKCGDSLNKLCKLVIK